MPAQSRAIRHCLRFSRAASIIAIAIGAMVLVGWQLDVSALKSIAPGYAQMKPNTALGFILCGIALRLRQIALIGPGTGKSVIAYACAALAALEGLLTLSEYGLKLDLGIDSLLFHEALMRTSHGGRMTPGASTSFLMLGLSLLLLDVESRRGHRPSQYFALGTALIGLVAFEGYIFGADGLYRTFFYKSMALHTSTLLVILGFGVFFARPQYGLMATISSEYFGGLLARRLLPLVLITPIVIGVLRWKGETAGLYDTAVGISLFATANVIVFAAVVWATARSLNEVDADRRKAGKAIEHAAAELRQANERLQSEIGERRQAQERILRLNRVLSMLSGVNALIVRMPNREELFKHSCRIGVEHGRFGMAWIGLVEPETAVIAPAAWDGDEREIEVIGGIRCSGRADTPAGLGTVGQSVRENRTVFCNDIAAEPGNGSERGEIIGLGYSSVISLPLKVGGACIGVLVLYAKEQGFFDEEEVKLLTELAGDISFALEHIKTEEKVSYLAFHDALTGLPNRALFHEQVEQLIHAAGRGENTVTVVLIDLKRFRFINESLGRQRADEVLREIAARLKATMRAEEPIARIGADRFALGVLGISTAAGVAHWLTERIFSCFALPVRLLDDELRISAKAGIAMFPDDGAVTDTLLINAEAALRKAKSGGEKFVFYAAEMNARVSELLILENKLRVALERGQFVLYYQPKFDARTRSVTGVEALIRWQDPDSGLVPPAKFIPLLEETGLILEVGRWALHQAGIDARAWISKGFRSPRVAVNVSAIQVRQKDFVDTIVEAAAEFESAGGALDLELTESVIMENVETAIRKLEIIHGLGVHISVDDFGTGYSSLSYIAKLPITSLKIDRSFVSGALSDTYCRTIVTMVTSLAHTLQLKVIAEGVETEEQAGFLLKIGCDEMQGYLFSRPVPADEVVALVAAPAIGAVNQ